MNFNQFQIKWLKTIGIIAGSYLVVILLVVIIILNPAGKKLDDLQRKIKVKDSDLQIYKSLYLEQDSESIKNEQGEIQRIVDKFRSYLIPDEKIESVFLKEMGVLCKQAGIKLNRINPLVPDVMVDPNNPINQVNPDIKTWELAFDANYQQIGDFISLLEKNQYFWGINRLVIESGKENKKHGVVLNAFTIMLSTNAAANADVVNSVDLSNVNTLREVISKTKDTIVKRQSEQVQKFYAVKDPLYFANTIYAVASQQRKQQQKSSPQKPSLSLQGIIWDPVKPLAVVNDVTLKEGDMVKGVKIHKILDKAILCEWDGEVFEIELK
ncbi:MAG: hypothetical protein WC955_03215 [Elusimicrobiota bacterium]